MPLYGRATGAYREYADRASFDVAEITISLWVKWNAAASSNRAIQRGALGANGEFAYGVTGGGAHFFGIFEGGSARVASVAGLPPLQRWLHIVGTYQQADGFVRLYIDGASSASTAYSAAALSAGSNAIRMFETTAGTGHADVSMALLGVWGALLSADDRNALYAGANPATIRPDALVICDQLDSRTSIDTAGMVAPTDAGNLVATPNDVPYRRGRLRPMPGPRNITRRRRASPAGGSVAVTPTTAALVLTTYAPTVATPRVVTPTTAALTLTTFAPTVSTPVNCTPSTAALTLTAYAPTVATPVTVTPSTTALVLTTFAPTVSTPVVATPSTAALTLTTYAPTVTAGVNVTPTTAALTLTGYAPTVATPVAVTPSAAALVLTTYAPTVTGESPDDGGVGFATKGVLSTRKPASLRPTYRVFDTYSSKSVAQQHAQAAEQEQIRVRKVANRRAAILAAVMAACEDDYGL